MTETTVTPPAGPAPSRAEQLVAKLLGDPEISAKVRAEAKAMFSDVQFPEDRMETLNAPLRAELEALKAERAAEKEAAEKAAAEAAEKSAQTTLEAAITSARAKYSLSEEGFTKMVERMKATGNYTDAEAAAAWVAQAEPPAKAPRQTFGTGYISPSEGMDDDEIKSLYKNPEGYLDAQLDKFLQDPDAYVEESRQRGFI